MAPLPIIICGKNPNIAKVVREGLMPDFEVIHVVIDAQSGAAQIPLLLSSEKPAVYSNVGSGNYSNIPVAVVTGGGYDDESFDLMRSACKNTKIVPWLRPDKSKLKDSPPLDDIEAFGKNTAVRVRETLQELGLGKGEEGKEKEEWKTGVYFY